MDVEDPRQIGIRVEPVDEVGGKRPHESGQHQHVHIEFGKPIQKFPLGSRPASQKPGHGLRLRIHPEQLLSGRQGLEIEILGHGLRVFPGPFDDFPVIHHKGRHRNPGCARKAAGFRVVRSDTDHIGRNPTIGTGIENRLRVASTT